VKIDEICIAAGMFGTLLLCHLVPPGACLVGQYRSWHAGLTTQFLAWSHNHVRR